MKARRLAALMFTDMVGYSALAHRDEQLARELVREHRSVIREALVRFNGIEHDTAGDGFFLEFGSAIEAVECAVEIQSLLFDRNKSQAFERQIEVRIGIHLGDIVAQDSNVFGNGVNVAARVQPLARAGGICITQQIFDQVEGKIAGLSFKKLGHHKLKNIASGAIVYSVVTPWQRKEKRKPNQIQKSLRQLPFFENMSSVVAASLFSACLAFLIYAISQAHLVEAERTQISAREPAATRPGRLDLSEGWAYQIAPQQENSLSFQNPSPDQWRDFDVRNSWKYSETIRGKFWLMKRVKLSQPFEKPAMVLGLIPGVHRVFLNQRFIGGANVGSDLALYSFDRSFLKTGADGENEIKIEVESAVSLNPGLSLLPLTGAFVSEFDEAKAAVAQNQFSFGLLRNIYFSFSVFIFCIALAYAVFRRSSRAYFYFAFILLLGSLHLAYYSPLVTSSFDYAFVRSLKILGLTLVPLILVSSFLAWSNNRKAEFWNNAFAAFFMASSMAFLFYFSPTTTRFTDNFNTLILTALIYAAGALVFCGLQAFEGFKKRSAPSHSLAMLGLHASFIVLNFVGLAASLKRGLTTELFTASMRTSAVQLSLATPFIFAVVVVVLAVCDHIKQSHKAKEQRSKEDFALEALHQIHEAPSASAAAFSIHEKLTVFTKATRSTLYSYHSSFGAEPRLEILSSFGSKLAHGDPSQVELGAQPILRHVLKHRTPILIRDIHQDPRFNASAKPADLPSSYRTGSCMVIPIRSMGETFGVLTFADKKDQTSFTESEFAAAIELASTLALLLKPAHKTA